MYVCMYVELYMHDFLCAVSDLQMHQYVHVHVHTFLTCSAVDIEAVVPSVSDCASLVVRFPDGGHVDECRQTAVDLPVVLEFTSSQPVTLTGYLVFCDTNTRKK